MFFIVLGATLASFLLTLLFGFSANAATYKVSDTPADLANLENGAKVVMYNIGAEKLVGYNNGEVSKKEIAVTDDDRAAYVFTVKKSGSTVASSTVRRMAHRRRTVLKSQNSLSSGARLLITSLFTQVRSILSCMLQELEIMVIWLSQTAK